MKQSNREALEQIIADERDDSYKAGFRLGLQVAARILEWWGENHKLMQPHKRETLQQWSENAIMHAKQQIGDPIN